MTHEEAVAHALEARVLHDLQEWESRPARVPDRSQSPATGRLSRYCASR
jgi:hypothetical protein